MKITDLSTDDLKNIQAGNWAKVSTAGLQAYRDALAGGGAEGFPASAPAPSPASIQGAGEMPASRGEAIRRLTGVPETGMPLSGLVPGKPQALMAAKALPAAGAVIGSVAGAPGGLLGSASGAYVGAAGGRALQQVAERALGEGGPETPAEAAEDIKKVGLTAALTDLGVGTAVKATMGIAPTMLQLYSRMPAESLKRAIQRPFLIPLRGNAAKATVQHKGMSALRSIQESLNAARKDTGEAVGAALEGLQAKTKGQPLFSFAEATEIGEEGLRRLEAEDPVVREALGPSIKKLKALLKGFRQGPHTGLLQTSVTETGIQAASAKVTRARIRALDDLVDFARGGVRPVESNAVEVIIKDMRHALNAEMKTVAEQQGYTKLAEANAAHASLMDAVDELGGVVRTRTLGTEDLLRRFERLTFKFNKGAVDQEVFSELAQKFPSVAKPMEELLDSAAALTFTELPRGSGSFLQNTFRLFTHPRFVGAVIKGSRALQPIGAGLGAGVGAQSTSKRRRYEKPMP